MRPTTRIFSITFVAACLSGTVVHASSSAPSKTIPLDVKFEFGKADLDAKNLPDAQFKDLALELQNYPFAKLEIEGYTDSTGPAAFNEALSEKRAMAIRTCLIEKYGISSERIATKAYGEKNPEVPNMTPEGRQMNRRALARIYRLEPEANGQNGHNL